MRLTQKSNALESAFFVILGAVEGPATVDRSSKLEDPSTSLRRTKREHGLLHREALYTSFTIPSCSEGGMTVPSFPW